MISKESIFSFLEKVADDVKFKTDGKHHQLYAADFDKDLLSNLPKLDKKDKELYVDMHGGGHKGGYTIANNSGDQGAQEKLFGMHIEGSSMKDSVDKAKHEDINSVYSIACNGDGGGTPEFYEKLTGKDLTDVTMTPPGYLGYSGQQFSNGPGYLYNTVKKVFGGSGPDVGPQHHYHRVDDKTWGFTTGHHFEDQGEHHTSFDQGVSDYGPGVAVGGGLAALAYGLWKRHKTNAKRDKLKTHIVKPSESKKREPESHKVNNAPWKAYSPKHHA